MGPRVPSAGGGGGTTIRWAPPRVIKDAAKGNKMPEQIRPGKAKKNHLGKFRVSFFTARRDILSIFQDLSF